jgi:hypothetical protein
MGFNQFSTGFVLGAVITGLAALLFTRCPRPAQAGERPVSDDAGNGKVYDFRKAVGT